MKVGDKKQAVILTVVAVGAMAFLVTQLMPAKRAKLQVSPASRAASVESKPSEVLPLVVIGNPFSHPKLATKPTAAVESTPVPQREIWGDVGVFDPGALPQAGETNPEESAGEDRKEEKVPLVTLTGLMRVDQPVAMLAVQNRDPKSYAVGDLVAPKTRLVAIGDSSVTLRVNGKLHTVRMGETLGADKEQSQ